MLYNYIKIAFRHLWKNKLYSIINVLGLAIALTCVVLSILYYKYERSFDSFHKNIPHLFRITTKYVDNKTGETGGGGGTAQVQGPAFKAQIPEILDYVRIYGGDVIENVKSTDKAFNLGTGFVDSGFFKIFSFPLLYGNPNTVLKGKYSVVVTEKTARKFFGTTDVVGKRLDVEDNPDSLFGSFTITGVAKDPPSNSSIQFDILIPFSYLQAMWDDKTWLNSYLPTFVVLHPKANLKTLEQKFLSIHNVHAKDQLEEGRKTGEFDKQTFYKLQPVTDIHLSPEGGFANSSKPGYSYFLMGISVFILMMASINFINLGIAGSLKRAKEIGVRKISGSSKIQIIWQFLIESSIICIIALCLALILSQNLLPFFNQLADRQIIFSTLFDWKLLAYFICLLVVNILLAGLYPSFVLARFKPTEVLYNKTVLSGRNWLGKSLVVLQFSIAICLIIASVIYYRQMDFVCTKDLGYNPYNIIRIDMPPRRNIKLIYATIKNELSKEPGILQISFEGNKDIGKRYIADKPIDYSYKAVDESYIPMLEIPIKEGRNFSDLYGTDKTNAIIVNEAFVKTLDLQNPVGTQIYVDDWYAKKTFSIIGVVKDYHQGSLKKIIQPIILVMNDGTEGAVLLKIDKNRQKQSLAALAKAYNIAIPGAEYTYTFWDELNAREYQQERKWQQIINVATFLSLLICCLGLFGLTHLATHMRIKEIGVRKVLGATVSSIASLITKDFVKLIAISVVIASPIAWYFMNEWLQDFAYRTRISWWIFGLAGILALIIALLTVSFQAIKAAMANPVKSLRNE
ncbi:MAG TPA: ABC transporter permease [Chitinophagaceae bacterium]|nr:ABC transporter permease [Chitinophagaceae bacterium]